MAGLYDYTPAPKARRFAFLFALGTAVLCVLSQVTINVGLKTISFLMVPTLAIYLWPKGANPILSLVGICCVGFFQDYLSYGPLGIWPLTWLLFFLVYRPDLRLKPETLWGQWAGAILVLGSVALFQWALGRLVLGQTVEIKSLILSSVAALMIFPLMHVARVYFARMFGDGADDFYYERPAR